MKRNRTRTCKGKVRYRDHQEATNSIHTIKNRSTRDRVPVRVYECEDCNGYHITSQRRDSNG